MRSVKKKVGLFLLLTIAISLFASSTFAGGNEYDAVCDHLEEKYDAKKVKIPFMWLARIAVGIVRPAGVKAFKVTIYRNLKFSPEALNEEMKATMRNSFSAEWTPILRVRSAKGEHVYMNMREAGKNVKILMVTINQDEAVVVRAKFNPDKLVEFLDNPRMFGFSLSEKKEERKLSDDYDSVPAFDIHFDDSPGG
ncbi:MAG: DUF4252 domain-containing protein [Acidobacteriota bacterium]|nr:DUF4252 domain-containing protein [Acidobacteriota bacterium]